MPSVQETDSWRPGFARRAGNFDEVCAAADAWRWTPGVTVHRLADACVKGGVAGILNAAQKTMLALLVSHLNQDRLEGGDAWVWPSPGLLAAQLGCSESTARANRQSLEALGFLVREYNGANRPVYEEAYSLAPFIARLEALEAADAEVRATYQAQRASWRANATHFGRTGARAPINRRLEQSYLNASESVQDQPAAPTARNSTFKSRDKLKTAETTRHRPATTENGADVAKGSPGRAVVSVADSHQASGRAERVREELAAAVEVCPRIAELVTPALLANPLNVPPDAIDKIAAAAQDLLPEPFRNNNTTAMWGVRKHGARVIAMLAIAIETPAVESRCGYFAKLALSPSPSPLDLRPNFRTLARQRPAKSAPAAVASVSVTPSTLANPWASPGSSHPTWQAISAELRRIVCGRPKGAGVWGSYLERLGFQGLDNGVLAVTAPNETVVLKVRADYLSDLVAAARTAGFDVDRATITRRPMDVT